LTSTTRVLGYSSREEKFIMDVKYSMKKKRSRARAIDEFSA